MEASQKLTVCLKVQISERCLSAALKNMAKSVAKMTPRGFHHNQSMLERINTLPIGRKNDGRSSFLTMMTVHGFFSSV